MPHVPTILCIDDNVLGLAIRKAMLESKDYRVFTAENGSVGRGIVSRQPVDLVIVDYEMPDVDGSMVVKELRRKQPGVPILLLTGFPGQLPHWLLAIVDGFIAKGGSPEVLLQEVERVTDAHSQPPEQTSQAMHASRKRVSHSHSLLESSRRLLWSSRQQLQRCGMSGHFDARRAFFEKRPSKSSENALTTGRADYASGG